MMLYYRLASFPVALAMAGFSVVGCGSEPSPPPPPTGPAIVAVSPTSQSMSAGRQSVIAITFDRAIVGLPTGQAIQVFGRWSGPMPGQASLAADGLTLSFTPSSRFAAGEWVTVTLSGEVSDAGGASSPVSYSWNFWIASAPGLLSLTHSATIPIRRTGEGWIQSYGSYAGDLDSDGYPDLVVPNERSNDLRVFMNDGAGNYAGFTVIPIPQGARPSPNEGADFDGDGAIDFAVGNSASDVLSVFRGDGSGSLTLQGNHVADDAVRGVCVLDFDGDGWPDIVTANRNGSGDGSLTAFANDGTGAFGPGAAFDAGAGGETACAAADADGDGVLDLFIGAFRSREVVVMLGDGHGGFTRSHAVAASGGPWMIAAGDVDGDGLVDVVTANYAENTASTLLGDGAGGLRLAGTVAVGVSPIAVDLGDIDGDGDLDMVTSNYGSASWTIIENLGGGVWGNQLSLAATGAGSCGVLVDRDDDGDLDLIGIDELDDLVFVFTNQ